MRVDARNQVYKAARTLLCVALDEGQESRAVALAESVRDAADVLKVGATLFGSSGPGVVRRLAQLRPVFLDLKLHDIPAQVAGATKAAVEAGAMYLTVHAAGGREMVQAAAAAAGSQATILAVTVLTSLDHGDLVVTGAGRDARSQVLRLADLALEAGAGGLVCSPQEIALLRDRFGTHAAGGPLLVVPGIRAQGAEAQDQKRTLPARAARELGADIIVVGRPITAAPEPASAAAAIKAEIG